MKTQNAYCREISPKLYRQIPKTVLAAIAISPQQNGGALMDLEGVSADEYILREWRALHANGIVPQVPPGGARRAARESR